MDYTDICGPGDVIDSIFNESGPLFSLRGLHFTENKLGDLPRKQGLVHVVHRGHCCTFLHVLYAPGAPITGR